MRRRPTAPAQLVQLRREAEASQQGHQVAAQQTVGFAVPAGIDQRQLPGLVGQAVAVWILRVIALAVFHQARLR